MGNKNKHQNLPPLDTAVPGPTPEGRGSAAAEMGGLGDHIQKLKQVSSTTQKLVSLLGDQLQGLSTSIPVLRGFEVVEELRKNSQASYQGIQDAFGPLRAYIEHEKALFRTKNAEAIEKIIQRRVQEGIKRKLPIALEERLSRYEKYLKINTILTDELRQVIATTSARAANALLSPGYPDEQVTLILPHPSWSSVTLGNLRNIGGPAAAELARTQGLTLLEDSPDSELARVHNINAILRHLGVQYQAIPSWNGIILTSVSGKAHL